MRPAGTPARRVLKPGGASGNTRTSSGPSTMGLPMLPRPCAGGGPWGFSWAGATAAATSSRIAVLNMWALFFITIVPSGGVGLTDDLQLVRFLPDRMPGVPARTTMTPGHHGFAVKHLFDADV